MRCHRHNRQLRPNNSMLCPRPVMWRFYRTPFPESELRMRSLMALTLVCGLIAQSAHVQVSSSGRDNAASGASRTVQQEPFRMPASEQDNIAANPSWTATQEPFRIYGNTWY